MQESQRSRLTTLIRHMNQEISALHTPSMYAIFNGLDERAWWVMMIFNYGFAQAEGLGSACKCVTPGAWRVDRGGIGQMHGAEADHDQMGVAGEWMDWEVRNGVQGVAWPGLCGPAPCTF